MDNLFPQIQKRIENLIEDEEGNIPGKKLLSFGTMMVILGVILTMDAFAGHRSHSSHSSHSSHRSSSTHSNSHYSHGSHESHVSHVSHTSHSNTYSHSNSRYSAEGDVTYSAPKAASVPKVAAKPVITTAETFKLPKINESFENPNGTPIADLVPPMAIPGMTPGTEMDVDDVNSPPPTDDMGQGDM